MVKITLRPHCSQRSSLPVPIDYEAGWAQAPVWAPVGSRTPNRLARGIVIVRTACQMIGLLAEQDNVRPTVPGIAEQTEF